jgi:hypothetical protein
LITLPTKRAGLGLAALLAAGASVPALSQQQDRPESLLPPGFDQPAPAPAPRRQEPTTPAPAPIPPAPDQIAPPSIPVPSASEAADAGDVLGNSAEELPEGPVDLAKYELPESAKHSLARIGATAAGNAPFPANGFGNADGRFLTALMRRTDVPIASRWASIVLRRALMSPLDTPAHVHGADFAAERAWLLLRMGEAVAARGVVADVDTENYTGLMFNVAMQVALANADPAALCPIADAGLAAVRQRGWALAQAMCMGLAGKPSEAGSLLTQARWGTPAGDIDTLLAEKILGTGAQGRRAVTIEWQSVPQLTAWRWGLATATGQEVPASLYGTVGPQVRYWQALAPQISASARAAAAEQAAVAGVFSNAGLVDLYSEIAESNEGATPQVEIARDLRAAYTGSDVKDRLRAIHTLWDEAKGPRAQYARLILTARAASWIPANANVEEPERLIASMLSAGMEGAAMEWRNVVKPGSEGWALLTLADPGAIGPTAYGNLDTFRDVGSARKVQMVFAGLAGLGRLQAADVQRGAETMGVQVSARNDWTHAIDEAGRRKQPALVALLAAVGLQSRGWDSVTPEALYHIVSAMHACGMSSYARMIAVEAVTRTA